jgi:hypothetical protein
LQRGALAAGLLSGSQWALAQPPFLPTGTTPLVSGPVAVPNSKPVGPWLKDTYIGRPDMFYEPPLGYYARNNFGVMKAKADPHRFTLYRTDFLPGTNRLSPNGAMRFNLMAKRLPGWLGPVMIEWSPDEPGLAEARRAVVLAMLAGAGQPVIPQRVVIGPSPYPGTLGTDGANFYNVMITRDFTAPSSLPLPPNSFSTFGTGGGGGGGGAGGP